MKKNVLIMALGIVAILVSGCSSAKKVGNQSYGAQSEMVKEKTREVDKLAAAEADKMRAVGVGNDYEEKEARREAMNDARNTLAGYIETAVLSLTQEYHKKTTKNGKKLSEGQVEGTVETAVSQKVSTRMVGVPEIYKVSDGTIQVYVCLELTKPNEQILGEVYDKLSQDDILGVDYDKKKFIEDNKERIQELREKSK